jgi:twitching motility protein PilT
MKAAETGHLLISTVHTPDAQSTVLRILAMFPPEEQDVVRVRLAESLHAVISQRLLPRKDSAGRVAALEIMIVTPTIRDLMLDRDRVGEIRDHIAGGREQYGMQTFDQHLEDLVIAGMIDQKVAIAAATRPADLALKFSLNS